MQSWFQFQIGTIGRHEIAHPGDEGCRFNSRLVRLVDVKELNKNPALCVFQFQIGTIGRTSKVGAITTITFVSIPDWYDW